MINDAAKNVEMINPSTAAAEWQERRKAEKHVTPVLNS